VALARADISEGRIACTFRVVKISALGTLAVTNNWSTLRKNINYVRSEAIEWDTRERSEGRGLGELGYVADMEGLGER
jgi:hypothetical protein